MPSTGQRCGSSRESRGNPNLRNHGNFRTGNNLQFNDGVSLPFALSVGGMSRAFFLPSICFVGSTPGGNSVLDTRCRCPFGSRLDLLGRIFASFVLPPTRPPFPFGRVPPMYVQYCGLPLPRASEPCRTNAHTPDALQQSPYFRRLRSLFFLLQPLLLNLAPRRYALM